VASEALPLIATTRTTLRARGDTACEIRSIRPPAPSLAPLRMGPDHGGGLPTVAISLPLAIKRTSDFFLTQALHSFSQSRISAGEGLTLTASI